MALRERENRNRKRRGGKKLQRSFYIRMLKVFGVLLVLLVLANFIKRDQEFSDEENRMLTQRPKLTWESLMNGDYMTDYESYVSDQFVARNQWITLKLYQDMLLGKKESNGVYLGKDGYLIEKPDEPDWESIERNTAQIAALAERYPDIPTYTCFVPNAYNILSNRLPAQAPVRDQEEDLGRIRGMLGSSVRDISVDDALREHADEEIYYRTDHHWTSLGAYYAFGTVAEAMGIQNVETDYNIHTVASDFQGTLASKSGYHGSEDLVQIYEAANLEPEYVVTYVESNEKSTSIYKSECLNEKDKYTVFFGGNHARVDIATTQPERRNLLVFKDSYANCFMQFLLPYYQNIIMVDARYFYDNVDSLIQNYAITDILFLYNVNTFVTDNSLADVLAVEGNGGESPAEEGAAEEGAVEEGAAEDGAAEDGAAADSAEG